MSKPELVKEPSFQMLGLDTHPCEGCYYWGDSDGCHIAPCIGEVAADGVKYSDIIYMVKVK